jgi:hypothetical protein
MSDMAAVERLMIQSNYSKSWAGSGLARVVHGCRQAMRGPVLLFAMLTLSSASSAGSVGCVIPPSLEADVVDAQINSPPAIVSVISDQQALPEPGPVLFDVQSTDTLSISLVDTDVSDTLYVGIFVDYNLPNRLAARARCNAPPGAPSGATPQRTATCRLNSLCVQADLGVQRAMTIMVFDRPPDETGAGDPPFQAMSADSGGLSTSRFYFLKCQPAQ